MKIEQNLPLTSRHDDITFSIDPEGTDLTGATIKWTIYDKWLGNDPELYAPVLLENGGLVHEWPMLENYFDRIITHDGEFVTTKLYYPIGVLVQAEVIGSNFVETLELLVEGTPDDDLIVKASNMRLTYKNIKCAPILSTHLFKAWYVGDETDGIVTSHLLISEDENKTVKMIVDKDASITVEHTWKTMGRKYLVYRIFYDDGFRLRSVVINVDFSVQADEILDKDDPHCVIDPHHHLHETYDPRLYVICTKRCLTGITQEYSFKVNGSEES